MSRVFKQQTNRSSVGICIIDAYELVRHNALHPSTYESNGRTCVTSFVGCLNPMCMRFMPDELRLSDTQLSEFPIDIDDSACPTNALLWERGNTAPTVVAERCINCGICARRCPIEAIYSNGNSAVVYKGEPEVEFRPTTPDNIELPRLQMSDLIGCQHIGKYLEISDSSIQRAKGIQPLPPPVLAAFFFLSCRSG